MFENNRYFLNPNDFAVMIELRNKKADYDFEMMLTNLSEMEIFNSKDWVNTSSRCMILDSLEYLNVQELIMGFRIRRVLRQSSVWSKIIVDVGDLSAKGRVIVDSFLAISDGIRRTGAVE